MKLEIVQILGTSNGYSKVRVSQALFDAVKGQKPTLPLKDLGWDGDNKVRLFDIGGVQLYSLYSRTDGTKFVVSEADAKANLSAEPVKLPFDIKSLAVA